MMDPDSSWIEELLKNNHPPSEEAAKEVRRLLLKPSKELEDLDDEVINLRNRLANLERRRREVGKRVEQYQTILSPIRRVPLDVLGEIFYHCLPITRNPLMTSSDCPLLLTRVCSTWRTAAMTTPKLWDRLYITFTDEDTVPNLDELAEMARNGQYIDGWRLAPSKVAKERTTTILRRRLEAVREWFLRSGTRPLSISIFLSTTPWYTVPYSERPPSVTMEFLSFLASLAPRWQELEVKSSSRLYRVLEDMLPISQMKTFTSLRVEYHPQYPEREDGKRPPRLMSSPNLRRLSMAAGDNNVWGLNDRSSTPWNQLTHITCLNNLTITETIFLFENASNLVHYKGIVSEYPTEDMPLAYTGKISLPFLQSLFISEYLNPQRIISIYDSIDAPKLQWFTYASQFSTESYSVDNPVPIPIFELLRKSTELQYLSLDMSDLTLCDLGALLRAIPSVTDLSLGQEGKYMNLIYATATDYGTSGLDNRTLWSPSDLIVRCGSSDDFEEDSPLLPRLTSLSITNPNVRISDDILFDLIKSRMVSSTTANLKRVTIMCPRQMERNIAEELERYAELVGVKIDLELLYAQPPPSAVNTTSPDFGIRGKDGQSWPYTDAGDYVL